MSDASKGVPISLVRDLVRYDQFSGKLYWVKDICRKAKMGQECGIERPDGYRRMKIKGKSFYCHRVAWAVHYGSFCENEIDHVNGDRSDNRIVNLRECTKKQNQENARPGVNNSSGVAGVGYDCRAGKWRARITVDGRRKSLGNYDSLSDAISARNNAKLIHHSFSPVVEIDADIIKKINGWSVRNRVKK